MSFWGTEKWLIANNESSLVDDFSYENIEDSSYKLSVGGEAIVSSSHEDNEEAYRKIGCDDVLSLKPGQFAYLITHEKIYVPKNAIGFINVSTSTKFKGLINVSGFHVDPGYRGKLIFTVFNAGPATITLHFGQKIFKFWISDFDGVGGDSKTSYDKIPREWADRLHGTYPSPFVLASRVSDLEAKIERLGSQRTNLTIGLGLAALLLLPFVGGMYYSIYATWFLARMSPVIDRIYPGQSAPNAAAIPPTTLPGPSSPPTPATPDASRQR